jgi:hypothetical protein
VVACHTGARYARTRSPPGQVGMFHLANLSPALISPNALAAVRYLSITMALPTINMSDVPIEARPFRVSFDVVKGTSPEEHSWTTE